MSLAAWKSAEARSLGDELVKAKENAIEMPAGLHPDTQRLVLDFAQVMAEKLHAAQDKYGYSNGWLTDPWMDICKDEFRKHIEKGDPRDVAIYAAFMWKRGWPTHS